ncbi:MAG: hypothetical protein JXQ79_06655 [Rhodobacteraceae bacterium]|nr:hypothetical protein [Paracoccaceae bacterium]
MSEHVTKITPKEAVQKAYEYFDDLMEGRAHLNHRLLEGVRFDEHEKTWDVTIGFDIGREKKTGAQIDFLRSEREPIREFRLVKVKADDGSFISMDNVWHG